MDETYQSYVNRVAPMTLPASHKAQLENIQKSGKFEGGKPVFFPGYTIITPTCQDDLSNKEFYEQLKNYQQELLKNLPSGLVIPVDPNSFHITIADLIWDNDYENAVSGDNNFDEKLKEKIALTFKEFEKNNHLEPINLQLFGVSIYPRALVALLVPPDQKTYDSILQLRRYIYQDSDLIHLGVEQQYGFTGHISLGYFGEIAKDLNREQVIEVLTAFNEKFIDLPAPTLTVTSVELRKFDNMNNYYRQPDWPSLKF